LQPRYSSLWLGANDISTEGTWVWQNSGNTANYTQFQSYYPNGGISENCLTMWQDNGNWQDNYCKSPLSFHVCEKPTTPLAVQPSLQSKAILEFITYTNNFRYGFPLKAHLQVKFESQISLS